VKIQYLFNGFFIMSLTLTLIGESTVLVVNYFPLIHLSDDNYKLGLMVFETYYTNVNASNNKFYFGDDVEIMILKGSYELQAINEFLNRANYILRKHPRPVIHFNDEKKRSNAEDEEYPIAPR